ncbi:MAG: formate dehydrogenase [Desulfitibacter sp. BRH_c19]|nr:MAG: formate dehydrogenase [Desulfitibacter sp. BRH_c19]
MTNSIEEIADADFILAIGTNTTETHPIISLKVRKAIDNGANLVVADPRRTEMAELANTYLSLTSGSDLALLNAMANVIIKEDLYNKSFVEERTEGFEELKAGIEKYTAEFAESISGIPADVIRQVARDYATAEKSTILYTMGITQHITGTDNVLAIANLALLTGQIGRRSTGVNPLRGQNNVQGACDMGGLPNVYPAYQKVDDPEVKAKFEKAWGTELDSKAGLTLGEILKAAGQGTVKSLYIIGENPVISDPDTKHVVEAIENVDFLVVQDIFLTDTAKYADVVLPATSFAEKEGTFTNTERRVQKVNKAIDPVGDSKEDWEIVQLVAQAMGYPMNYSSPSEIMDEIATVAPSYGGINYQRLAIEKDGLQWPCPTTNHPGTPILHTEKFTRGKGKLSFVEYQPPAEQTDEEYPLVLTTGRKLWHYHTGTMTRRSKGLDWKLPEERIEVNPAEAQKYCLQSGDKVKLMSRRGSIESTVEVTDRVQPGLVFGSFHFKEAAINKLTNPAYDPKAQIPEFKVCAVKLEKV